MEMRSEELPGPRQSGNAAYLIGGTSSGALGAIGFVGVGIAAIAYLVGRARGNPRGN
jgi:hypothetical protein